MSSEVFDQAKAMFGTRGIVDMVMLAGTYETVCSLLNTFDVPAPEGWAQLAVSAGDR